jgi:hypothetical protein
MAAGAGDSLAEGRLAGSRLAKDRRAEGPEFRAAGLEGFGDPERISLRAGEGSGRSAEQGREKAEKTGESRRNSRKRSTVELRDYRELSPGEGSPGQGSEVRGTSGSSSTGSSSTGASEEKIHPELFRELSVDMGSAAESENRGGGNGFEGILARELRQTVNDGIVRNAQVILRDGGEGLIRLSLKPESLGNVKIRLELTENKIAGRVIVESGEVLRAFERELASLEQAFRDSGYESAELSAFLAQDGQGSGHREQGEAFYSPRYAADKAASRYDDTLEKTNPSISEDFGMARPGNGSINMLV